MPLIKIQKIINDFIAKSGNTPRAIDDQEILERCLYPMVNEGAKILEEGMAQRASDIDVTWMNGYGWPAFTGGPMFWADQVGLDKIVAGLEKHMDKMEDGFTISPLLKDKAAKGETFN